MSRKDFQTPVGQGETARASGEEVGKIEGRKGRREEGRMGVYDFTSKHKNTHAAALDPARSASGSALAAQMHRGSSTDRKRGRKQDKVVHWEHTLCRLKHTETSDSCNVGECIYITSATVQEPSCQRPHEGGQQEASGSRCVRQLTFHHRETVYSWKVLKEQFTRNKIN